MSKLLLFVIVIVLMAIAMILQINARKKSCGRLLYKIPVIAYRWHIFGLAFSFVLFTGILYADIKTQINLYLPPFVFTLLDSAMAGMCIYALIMYIFTPAGIYDNGVLTHFLFLEDEEIDAYNIEDSNMLNIGNNRTVSFKIKQEAFKYPSIEIPHKDSDRVEEHLKAKQIRKMVFESDL